MKFLRQKTKHYILIEKSNTFNVIITRIHLNYRERNDSFVKCLRKKQIQTTLIFFHEIHKHFFVDISIQRFIKRFY